MEYIAWLATIVAMIGVMLNAQGKVLCFYLWIGSNGFFVVANMLSDQYAQAALFAFNLAMAIYGIRCWKRKGV